MAHVSRSIPSCTAQLHTGAFCDAKSIHDAPFPICVKHAGELLRFLNSCMPADRESRIILAARDFDYHPETPRKSATAERGVVYYIRVGALIKIGFTADLRRRMNHYPPDSTLLACEPGDLALERKRHQQFTALLREAREWFEPAKVLINHIDAVSERYPLADFLPAKRSPTAVTDQYNRPRVRGQLR